MNQQFIGRATIIKVLKLIFMCGICLGLGSCGPKSGFKIGDTVVGASSGGSTNNTGNQNGQGDGNLPGPDNSIEWSKVQNENNGLEENSKKLQVIIDKDKQMFRLILPLPEIFLMALGAAVVKELPGTTIEEIELEDQSRAWALNIPLKYLLKGAKLPENFNSLPNGDVLPFFPAGEVQGLSIQFSENAKYSMRLYLSVNAVAVFVSTPDMDHLLDETFPPEYKDVTRPLRVKKFTNKDRTAYVGYFEVILPKGTSHSGIYMAGRLTRDAAVTLGRILKY